MLYAHKSIASKDHQLTDRFSISSGSNALENQSLCPTSMKSFSLPSILIPQSRNNFSQMRLNDNFATKFINSSNLREIPSTVQRCSGTPCTTATTSYDTPSPYSDHYLSDFPRILTSPSNANDGDELLNKLEISGKVPSKDKFRRMACMTFVCTGACPYNERCVFLHDSRLRCGHLNGKTRPTRQPTKQNALIKDTFYWPDMMRGTICSQLDPYGLPDVNQMYVVPDSFSQAHSSMHNKAIFSLWAHFSEFCSVNCVAGNTGNNVRTDGPWFEHPFFNDSDLTQSRYLHEAHRLPVFALLSCSASFYRKEEVRVADCGRVVGSGRRPCLSVSPSQDTGFSSFDSRTTMGSSSSSSDSIDGSQSYFGSGLTSKDSSSTYNNINNSHQQQQHPFYSPMFLSGSTSQDSVASMRPSSYSSRGPDINDRLLSPQPLPPQQPTETNGGRIRTDAAGLSGPVPVPGSLSLSPIESVAPSSSWLSSPAGPAAFTDLSASYLQMNSPTDYLPTTTTSSGSGRYYPAVGKGSGLLGEDGGWSLEKIMSDLEMLWAPTAEDDAFDTSYL